MVIKELSGKRANIGGQGFSLVELLVVVAILGILSIAVGMNINSAKTKLKTFVFNTKTRFNQARFEAIKRSRNVYLDFDFDGDGNIDNGYTIWMNDDNKNTTYDDDWSAADPYVDANANNQCDPGEGDCNSNGKCDPGEGDCLIDTVDFALLSGGRLGPEIYNQRGVYPFGGPKDPTGGPDDKTIDDGVTIVGGGTRFKFKPNGDSSNGSVYFYFPEGPVNEKEVNSGPYAIIVNTVGRIRIDEWKSAGYGWEGDR
jgi:prepilin-type N-terminal cleavage/methylation domain-containing protein